MADDKIFDAKDLLGDFKKETEKAKQEVAKELQEVGKSIIADVKAMRQDVKKQVESQQKLVGKIEADIDVVLNSDNISDTVKQQMTTIKKEIEKETKKSTATQLSASFSVINKGQIKDAQRLGGQVRTAYESALEGKKNAPKRFVEYFSAGKYKDSIDSEYGFAIPFKEKEFSEMENYYNELIANNKQLQEVAKLASQEMENQIHLIEQQRKATGALREQLDGTNIKTSSPSSQQSGNQTEVLSGDDLKTKSLEELVQLYHKLGTSNGADEELEKISNAILNIVQAEKQLDAGELQKFVNILRGLTFVEGDSPILKQPYSVDEALSSLTKLSNQTPLSSESKTAENAKETAEAVKQANDKIVASNEEVAASEEKVRKYRLASRGSVPKLKSDTHSSNEASNMKDVATYTEEAVAAKKEFATANEGVQTSVDGSKSKLQIEAELMESIAKSAREAAKAKKEFAEANELVQKSVDGTKKATKADKYKDKNKVSEDDYTSKSGYYASIANEKLLASGNTILGGSTSTELIDGLVKVSAKIKTADNTWKTFSAKIDADGNMFEQRFRTIAKGIDKLERELADFESGSKPALTYGETLEKVDQIRKSLNLGDDYSIKVDSNELVTITKRLKDVDSTTSSVTQTFKSAQDAIENFGKEASSAAEKTSISLKPAQNDNGTRSQKKSSSDVDKITNAYKTLINTEKRYRDLKRKKAEGIITPTEIGVLDELTQKRDRANEVTQKAIRLNEKQIELSKEYATVQKDVNTAMLKTAAANEKQIASRMLTDVERIKTNKKDFQYDSDYEAELNSVLATIKNLNEQAENLEFVDEEDIQDFVRLRQVAELALDALKTKAGNLQFKTPDVEDVKKKMVEIQKIMDQNTKMPREMKETFEALQNKYKLLIDTKGSVSQFKALNAELEDMILNLQKSGKTGKSFFSQIGQRLTDMNAKFFATYFSMQDIIRYARQGFETIKEYDKALTEMNKVSKESIQTLKEFQEESFALANSVGTAASQIQNSTADFLRLGESFEQAKESAQDANALFKVSEFADISEATDALIAMSAAYKELEKSEINDILNYTGNNFSISTSELASALQKSAATLKVAGNDIYEATALVTAGNAVLQDAETVGAGLKMISLRILGTEEAKDELASLGENVDDFVVQTKSKIDETVRNYTAVASNEFKGISVLDDNGNYKSTYEILRDISQVYQEILEADKKAGTNRGQALLEVLAGFKSLGIWKHISKNIFNCKVNLKLYATI